MADINLLPDDFRRKENKHNDSAKKSSGGFDIKLHVPEKEEKIKEKKIKEKKPSFFSKFFIAKKKENSKDEVKINKPEIKSTPNKSGGLPAMTTPDFKSRQKGEVKFDFKNDTSLISDIDLPDLDLATVSKKSEPEKDKPQAVLLASSSVSQHLLKKPSWFSWWRLKFFGKKKDHKKNISKVDLNEVKNKKPEIDKKNLMERKEKEVLPRPQVISEKKHEEKKEKWFKKKQVKSQEILQNKDVNVPTKKEKSVYLDINLIPEDLGKMPERRFPEKIILTGIILAGLLLVIVFSYLGLTWYQIIVTRQIQDVKDDIIVIDGQIETYKDDEKSAKELQARLLLIQDLLDRHIYWTKFFSLLEKYTIDEVYYTNFSMSGRDRLVISAVGKDYGSAAKQLLVFSQATDFVKDVKIDGATALAEKTGEYAGVTFSVNLEFQPGVFLKPIQ